VALIASSDSMATVRLSVRLSSCSSRTKNGDPMTDPKKMAITGTH
jgi:hypothetical protein